MPFRSRTGFATRPADWRTFVLFLITATLFASYLVRIYAWRSILGQSGLINSGLLRLGVIDHPLGFLLYNQFSVTVALVHIFLPYVVLVLYAGFAPLAPALLESAQDLGANALLRWRRVVLPLVAAPAVSAFLFVFVLSAGDYVTPSADRWDERGSPGGRRTVRVQAVGDFPLGAATSLLMLAAFVALYLLHGVGASACAPRSNPVVELMEARQRSPFTAAITILALLFLFLPLFVVVLFSFHKTAGLSFPFQGFSLRWYRTVWSSDDFGSRRL